MIKLIVLIAVIAVVFLGFKYIGRRKRDREAGAYREMPRRKESGRFSWARRVFKAEDLVECPRCGTFVRSLADHACRSKA